MMWLVAASAQDFTYTNNNGAITITGYSGSGGTVTIPGSIAGLPVTGIGDRAFYNSPTVTSVAIPNGVTNIGSQAFSGGTSLTNVSISNSVLVIGNDAFAGCTGLASVNIPDSVTNLGLEAFLNCASLARLSIGTGITSINEGAYQLGAYGVFENCASLTRVTIPDNVSNIGDGPGSFGGAEGAFFNCSSLTNVTVGKGLAYLGEGTFSYCSNLVALYFQGNAPAHGYDIIGADIFTHDTATVYYLPGTSGWEATYATLPTALWNPTALAGDGQFGVRQAKFGFTIAGTANVPLVIEACANLAAPQWLPLQTCTLTNGSVFFSDAQWTNYPVQFLSYSVAVRWGFG